METMTFTTHTYTGVPVAELDTPTEMTDYFGNKVVVDGFWHNGSHGIIATGFKFRTNGELTNRRFQNLVVVPPQNIQNVLNALEAK